MKDDKILEVSKDVKWIGILDKDIVTFDIVMETEFGTTYNSYFINAEKKTIIETAKEKFKDVYFNKIKQVVDYSAIEYIVLDHTEPDHSGSLKHLLKLAPQATVVGSGNAIRYLQDMVDGPFKSLQVKDGDTLSLGNKTLQFIAAPNLHWPDSIYTYLVEDKILFTCDSFGAHYCHEEMFDDKVPNWDGAFKYYFDVILKPFSKFILKAIEKIRPLEINVICPGHGPILRTNWKKYIDLSEKYALEFVKETSSNQKNVLIVYVSSYGYTSEMAEAIAEGVRKEVSLHVETVDIEKIDLGELDSKLNYSQGIIVGCPTLNQNILLPVYKLFAIINPIRERGKLAMSFGSYGWSGEAVKIIDAVLKNLKLNVFHDGIASKFYPYGKTREMLVEQGHEFARAMVSQPVNQL
jgi:NADH oxidase (H2O-forming)